MVPILVLSLLECFPNSSFVTIWGFSQFEFCQRLCLVTTWVLSLFKVSQNWSFVIIRILSPFDFCHNLSFVIFLVWSQVLFYHNLSFFTVCLKMSHCFIFLAALSSSWSLVVRPSIRPLVGRSVHLCENVTFRLFRVSEWVSEWVSDWKKFVTKKIWLKIFCD